MSLFLSLSFLSSFCFSCSLCLSLFLFLCLFVFSLIYFCGVGEAAGEHHFCGVGWAAGGTDALHMFWDVILNSAFYQLAGVTRAGARTGLQFLGHGNMQGFNSSSPA